MEKTQFSLYHQRSQTDWIRVGAIQQPFWTGLLLSKMFSVTQPWMMGSTWDKKVYTQPLKHQFQSRSKPNYRPSNYNNFEPTNRFESLSESKNSNQQSQKQVFHQEEPGETITLKDIMKEIMSIKARQDLQEKNQILFYAVIITKVYYLRLPWINTTTTTVEFCPNFFTWNFMYLNTKVSCLFQLKLREQTIHTSM